MPVLIPQKGDGLQTLAYKLANNTTFYTAMPVIPKPNMHLHDLMLIAAKNLATGGGITPDSFAALDLDSLPTSDPGGGKPWNNGGMIAIGPI